MAYLDLELKEIEVEYVAPHLSANMERITLMLTVVRGARGKRKLLGEAFVRTVYHPVIHFKVFLIHFNELCSHSAFTADCCRH